MERSVKLKKEVESEWEGKRTLKERCCDQKEQVCFLLVTAECPRFGVGLRLESILVTSRDFTVRGSGARAFRNQRP